MAVWLGLPSGKYSFEKLLFLIVFVMDVDSDDQRCARTSPIQSIGVRSREPRTIDTTQNGSNESTKAIPDGLVAVRERKPAEDGSFSHAV